MNGHPGELLEAIADDPLPSRQTDRQHIQDAIRTALGEHDGFVTISWVRPHITRNVAPHLIGAVMSAYVRTHDLVWTGEYRPNGGPAGNAAKPARIWMSLEEAL